MKTVGIITYHKAYNYGSALQSYALNKYLRNSGYIVETIDFRTQKQADIYRLYEPVKSIFSIVRNGQSFLRIRSLKEKEKRFDQFINENITLSNQIYHSCTELSNAELTYDYYICGSDQIWNPNCSDFDVAYLLDFVSDKKKCVSYAPSIASDSIPHSLQNTFIKNLQQFYSLSIRESGGADIIENLIGKRPEVVLDPVFLLDDKDWIKLMADCPMKRPYIFCYFIGDVKGMRRYANRMRKFTGLPLVVVYKNIRDEFYPNKQIYSSGPKEFLSLLYHATYICTNSYHAVLFSFIFKKDFWVFINENVKMTNSRIYDIAVRLGVEERILSADKCDVKMESKIDYGKLNAKLEEERKKSFAYIHAMLNSSI